MSKISIKLEDKFSGKTSIHLIRYPDSYPQLLQSVRDTFKNRLPNNFSLSYKDIDDEIINLNNEEDFDAAIAFLQEEKIKSLKIFVTKREEEEENSEPNSTENDLKQSQIVESKEQIITSSIQNESPEKNKVEEKLQEVIPKQDPSSNANPLDEPNSQIINNVEEKEANSKVEIIFTNLLNEKPKSLSDLEDEVPPLIQEKNELAIVFSEEKKEVVEEENRPFFSPAQPVVVERKEEADLTPNNNEHNDEMFRTRIFEKELKEKEEFNLLFPMEKDELKINRLQEDLREKNEEIKNIVQNNQDVSKLLQEFICNMIEAPISFSYPCPKCLKKKVGAFNFMNPFCGLCQNKGEIIITNNNPKVKLLNNVLNSKLSFALAKFSDKDPKPNKPIQKEAILESAFKARIHQAPPDLTLTSAQVKATPKLILNIEMENNGSSSWPSQVFLICVEGYLKPTLKEVTSLAPGQKKAGKIEIKSPSDTKMNKLVWRLGWIEEEGIKYFGPNIVHRILVESEELEEEEWEEEKEGKKKEEEQRKKEEEVKKKAKELAEFCGYEVEEIEKFIRKNRLAGMKIEVIAEDIFEHGIGK